MLGFEPCVYDMSDADIKMVQDAIYKVGENIGELRDEAA
jgi:hypothetical protein